MKTDDLNYGVVFYSLRFQRQSHLPRLSVLSRWGAPLG